MARAIALTKTITPQMRESVRILIVSSCGVALIAAGQFLPL